MTEENKNMEFKETNENMDNNIPEETPKEVIQSEAPKKGLLAMWKGLKLWQKAAIIAGTATLIYVGGKWIFKGRKQANEHPVLDTVKVVTPMDPVNNAADAAVQNLVNEFANAAEETGANVVNF